MGTSFSSARREVRICVSILVVLDWAWGRPHPARRRRRFRHVSILVVLDWAWGHSARPLIQLCKIVVSILVVLDWAWGRSNPLPLFRWSNRFNPCCIGLGVGTCERLLELLEYLWFQSLLYWIGRGDLHLDLGDFGPHTFQSLLYWIGRGDCTGPACADPAVCCFNPCCIGLGVGTLVPFKGRTIVPCFNPCCIGLGVGTSLISLPCSSP